MKYNITLESSLSPWSVNRERKYLGNLKFNDSFEHCIVLHNDSCNYDNRDHYGLLKTEFQNVYSYSKKVIRWPSDSIKTSSG